MATASLLIVEDDEAIGLGLARALEAHGYRTHHVTDGATALSALDTARPDLVLLDLALPDVDGVTVCRRLTERHPHLPVVMLTARAEEVDIVVGLDAGAVDYVTKPFRLAELLARVRAHLRQPSLVDGDVILVGDLRVDLGARRSWIASRELDLRAKEFDLLAALAIDAGRVVTRERLMADVWDEHWAGSTKTLDVHIAAVRRHIDARDAPASRITTLRGVGYRLELP